MASRAAPFVALLVAFGRPHAAAGLSLPDSFASGRVAVITGGAAGLGKAAAIKCAARGMRVCLADIDEDDLAKAEKAVAEAAANGAADVLAMRCDVSEVADVQALHKAVYDRFGECGFLLNNAGTGVGAPSAYRDLDGWRTNLETNLFGILHVLQLFVPSMLAQETPCTIVNTGSKQGITCPPGNLAYNVGKAGVRVLTEGLQHELRSGEHAERVSAHLFVPGWVNTQLARNYMRAVKGDAFDEEVDVPWSEEKPASGAWMPGQCIDYLFDAIASGRFYVICPDNDVSEETDRKRIVWAAGDITERDVPLSRWDPQFQTAFAEYMTK